MKLAFFDATSYSVPAIMLLRSCLSTVSFGVNSSCYLSSVWQGSKGPLEKDSLNCINSCVDYMLRVFFKFYLKDKYCMLDSEAAYFSEL